MTASTFAVLGLIGAGVGFLSGMFGKGGSAVATPLLSAAGIPSVIAVASPLPATIPTTIAAAAVYWRQGWLDRRVLQTTLVFGVPATIAGAVVTNWIAGHTLVLVTDAVIAAIGVRLLFSHSTNDGDPRPAPTRSAMWIGLGVGFSAGLLANSGGALLAPLYLTVLRLPIKRTFATSLSAATVLAIPATIVHVLLGHIDWTIVAVLAATSVPLSIVGSRVAVTTQSARLERMYAVVLVALGGAFLAHGLL
ncbi:MAG TPA: sulfite exporter TauE/SafE family protein [Acidimicrobiales bacterium]|nr:sulfite exporter TauE/SafE family protein [Acidimicrobiales bacterium]